MLLSYMLIWLLFGQQTELAVQEQLRVEYVLIDLLVLDRQNQPITDLRPEDFIVKDGRKKIAIESFQILDYRDLEEDTALKMAITPQEKEGQAPERQQYIFALDQESLYLTEIRKSFNQLRRTIEETGLPSNADYLLYSMESGVITQGFVSGLDAFLTELSLFEDRLIERYGREIKYAGPKRNRGQGRASGGNRRLQELELQLQACLEGQGGAFVAENSRAYHACVSEALHQFVEDETYRLKRVLGELEALAYRFEADSGLKSIFFISPGFSLSPGTEAVELARFMVNSKVFGKENNLVGKKANALETLNFPIPTSYHKDFQKVVHACTRNRVVFHSLDIFTNAQENSVGISVTSRSFRGKNQLTRIHSDYLRQNSSGLERLATMSGGMYARAPSLKKVITQWMPRTRYVYLLGYTSPQGKPGAYRKITVKCKRKGANLHYRRGYYAAD